MSKQAKVKFQMLKSPWTAHAIEFANGLIQRKRHRRLGENGLKELKAHAWLKDFPWKYLRNRIIRPEFVPKIHRDNFDHRNVNKKEQAMDPEMVKLLKKSEIQEMFKEYVYKEDRETERIKEVVTLSTRNSTFD